jgi:hypothetical protein
VGRRGRRDLEFTPGQTSHLAGERAEGLEHEAREGPRDDPGQRQGESGQGHRLEQGGVELPPEQRGAETEADAAEGRAVEIHGQHNLVRLPDVVEGEEPRHRVLP